MADQIVRIKIPNAVVAVANPVVAKVRGGEMVLVSLEPAADGEVTIENLDDGIFISFKKKPFEGGAEIITPPIGGGDD